MEEKNKLTKTIVIIVLVFVLLFGGYYTYYTLTKDKVNEVKTKEPDVVKEKITPLLYEVTKEGSNNKMYLFGSVHATNKDDLNFPDYVINAYKSSDYLACEYDVIAYMEDQDRVLDDALNMMYDDQTTIEDHMSSDAYTKLVSFMQEKKIYNRLYEVYKLYFYQSLIANKLIEDSGLSAETGVDNYFLKKAKEDNKTILEVETSEFQNNLLASFPDELYELLIIEAIDNYDESVSEMKNLYDAWKTGNVEDLVKYSSEDAEIEEGYTKKQIEMVNDYNKKLIYDRNDSMLVKAIEYFDENKNVFFMVGEFHIVGDNGLAKQLEQKGYTVKQVK